MSLKNIQETLNKLNGSGKKGSRSMKRLLRTRRKVIDKATDIFLKKGYLNTAIDQVAASAHIGKRTFYYHFKNKYSLFMSGFEKMFSGLNPEPWPITSTNYFDVFVKRLREFLELYPKVSNLLNQLRSLAISDPKIFDEKYDKALFLIMDHMAEQVEKGIGLGILRPVDSKLAAISLMGMCDYFGHVFYAGRIKGTLTEVIKKIVGMLHYGMSASPAPK